MLQLLLMCLDTMNDDDDDVLMLNDRCDDVIQ